MGDFNIDLLKFEAHNKTNSFIMLLKQYFRTA